MAKKALKNGQNWLEIPPDGSYRLRMATFGAGRGLFSSLFCSDHSKWDLRFNFHRRGRIERGGIKCVECGKVRRKERSSDKAL